MSDPNGDSYQSNPSLGLGLWGPLVPASDCRPCLATLATMQLGAGAWLWLRPGRRPPIGRSVTRNRSIKISGILTGSYLIFMAGIEYARLALPYDPWVEDARRARENDIQMSTETYKKRISVWSPRSWWYGWFGPSDYRPVPWSDWQSRTLAYLEQSETLRSEIDGLDASHDTLVSANRSTAARILDSIYRGEMPNPEIPVEDLEAISKFPYFDNGEDDDELYDEMDMQDVTSWDFFQPVTAFSVIIVPRSTSAFLPGVKIKEDGNYKNLNVKYSPIPQDLKVALR